MPEGNVLNMKEKLSKCVMTSTANVTLIEKTTGMQYFSDTMQDVGIEFKEEMKTVEGGIGNPTIYEFGVKRDINVNISDAVSRQDWLAAKLGQQIQTGKVDVFQEPKSYQVVENKITLESEPNDAKKLKIFTVSDDPKQISAEDISVSGKEVTFSKGEVNGEVFVWGYYTKKDSVNINIESDKFAKEFEVIITSPCVILDGQGIPHTEFMKQYIFPLGKLSGDFKEDMKAKGDNDKFESKIKILKATNSKQLGRIVYFPIESLTKEEIKSML